MDCIVKLKRGFSDARTNYTPKEGELILEIDTNLLYVGDGRTPGGILVKNCSTLEKKLKDKGMLLEITDNARVFKVDEWEDLI